MDDEDFSEAVHQELVNKMNSILDITNGDEVIISVRVGDNIHIVGFNACAACLINDTVIAALNTDNYKHRCGKQTYSMHELMNSTNPSEKLH